MTQTQRKKIEQKIDRIDQFNKELHELRNFLWEISQPSESEKRDLTEEDVLKIIGEGNREYREGKTTELESLLKDKYPHLTHAYPKHSSDSKVRQKTREATH